MAWTAGRPRLPMGEPYDEAVMSSVYDGGDAIEIDDNNVMYDLDSTCVVSW